MFYIQTDIHLKYLNLAGNSFINSIDKELQPLSNLEFLSVEFADENEDDFESTMNAISKLPNLKILHIRNSYIKTLPNSFKDFKNLKQLSLRGNYDLDLKQAFELLSNIDSLEILDLSFSRIESLPDEIGKMTNLKTLYIGNYEWCCPMIHFHGGSPNNRVTKLPSSAASLKNLQNLYLWTWDVKDKEKKAISELLPKTYIEFETKQIDLDEEFKKNE
jgi:Leucine-rich repeat (LRR) protein